jgi:hypothetical protein
MVVWEDRWALRLVSAIRDAGGEVLVVERIPDEAALAAFEAMEV